MPFLWLLLLFCLRAHAAPTPVEEAQASFIPLRMGWKFAFDPLGQGIAQNWMSPSFSDAAWAPIESGLTWETQGFPSTIGDAWYRIPVSIPLSWKGSQVRLETDGVGDEYEVYVQGAPASRSWEGGFSVSLWPTQVDLSGSLEYGKTNLLAVRVTDQGWSNGGGLWRRIGIRRIIPIEKYRDLLPQPVLDDHPDWVKLYWEAWRLAWEKISFAKSSNPGAGWVPAFMEEGFNEQIYQWDSSFIARFGFYGAGVFPAMETLDNFYRKQQPDGYIQRSYSATTGEPAEQPTADEPAVNPPLYAWIEWEYYRFSGDDRRLARVLPVLEKYYAWMQAHLRTPAGQGLYFETGLGSGMDNIPRGDAAGAGWVDISMQQALAARNLALIAEHLGLDQRARAWRAEYASIKALIEKLLWSEGDGFYYDLQRSGQLAGIKHLGALWALVSGVASPERAARLIAHLRNPAEFHRAHLFPALSASEPGYDPSGFYWLGGVWAPTDFMTIKGLDAYGDRPLAHEAASNFLDQLSATYEADLPDSRVSALDRTDGFLHTLWECYAPESNQPCGAGSTGSQYGRAGFVGWTGLGPIALLIEDVIGIEVVGSENLVRWDLREPGMTGVRNLRLGRAGHATLLAHARGPHGRSIELEAESDFRLELRQGRVTRSYKVRAGKSVLTLPKPR